jgi:hypothetical protein
MKHEWHEQIQRHVSGQSSAEEAAALQQALHEDAELRDLYLDYVNLEAALGAAAQRMTFAGYENERTATFSQPSAWSSRRSGRWLAAAAAGLILAIFLVLPKHRDPAPPHPDVAAAIASTQGAIARMSFTPPSSASLGTSPTASLLDSPGIPQ